MTPVELRKLQLIQYEMLCLLDEFCKKKNIKYILYCGSALGAVRHQGFIPWDDDLDIAMPREDYERFRKEWKKCPVDGYSFQDYYSEPRFRYSFGKVRKDNSFYADEKELSSSMNNGIFVDIFPLDRVPDSKWKRKKLYIYGAFFLLYTRGYASNKNGGLMSVLNKIILKITPTKGQIKLREWLKKQLMSYQRETGAYVDFSLFEYLNLYFDDKLFKETELTRFESGLFPVPKDSPKYLSLLYGDYMKLPAEEEQICKHSGKLIFDLEKYRED